MRHRHPLTVRLLMAAALLTAAACSDSGSDDSGSTTTSNQTTSNQTSNQTSGDDTGVADTGEQDTGAEDTGAPDTDEADTGVEDTEVADTAEPDAADPCTWEEVAEPDDLEAPPIYTPRWAFEPWISKDISDGPDTYAFVDGFIERDIPVGAVVLDSPWETQYNTFIPNEERYPAFDQMVQDMHDRDVRVVLWMTQMVNTISGDAEQGGDEYVGPSPNYQEGFDCGFFVNDSQDYFWWKGFGSGLDFFNPQARTWWHRQQDRVLDAGVDGWKLDFGDSYIKTDPVATFMGDVPHQTYSEEYYRDFLAYGVHKRGREFVTMVRPWDESYEFEGRFFARPEHAPVAWVGDNRRDWVGLIDALDHIFISAKAGYVMVGSDIGGYLDRSDLDFLEFVPFDQDNFVRWTAVGAMTPFMQLHGRGNLTPWTVEPNTDETIAIYRYWSKLHSQLVPFFYSLAQEAYAGRAEPIIRPIGEPADWPGDYRFMVGDAFLVAPFLDGTGVRDVALPPGRWYTWWEPNSLALEGDRTVANVDFSSDQQKIPLYVRDGAIVPMHVRDDSTGLGTDANDGSLTVLVYASREQTGFVLHDDDDATTTFTAQLADTDVGDDTITESTVTVTRALKTTLLRVRVNSPPIGASVNGVDSTLYTDQDSFDRAADGAYLDIPNATVTVKLPATADPATIVVKEQGR